MQRSQPAKASSQKVEEFKNKCTTSWGRYTNRADSSKTFQSKEAKFAVDEQAKETDPQYRSLSTKH